MSASQTVDKRLGQIWIGPLDPPLQWMKTWRDMHPDWDYTLYDNQFLTGRKFKCHAQITEYFRQGEYAGVSDLMRYEILYEFGGIIPETDSICLRPVHDLLHHQGPFTCREVENEVCDTHGMPRKKGLLCPILGSPKGHPILAALIEELSQSDPATLPKPWKGSGNFRLRQFFKRHRDLARGLYVYPAYMFVPEHFRGWRYEGPEHPFCRQLWGTTTSGYSTTKTPQEIEESRAEILATLMAA